MGSAPFPPLISTRARMVRYTRAHVRDTSCVLCGAAAGAVCTQCGAKLLIHMPAHWIVYPMLRGSWRIGRGM